MNSVSELDVLIASPGDVTREREVAARAIQQLNPFLDCHKIRVRARMWEHDATPEIGDRPQAILNKQVGDSCDIFVGIMWTRIGTPTGMAESGTVEEFRRANARLEKNRSSVQILFFFSSCPISPGAIDPKQLAAVTEFRSEIERLGLISTYSSLEEFELKLRIAIYKTAIELVSSRTMENSQPIDDSAVASDLSFQVSRAADESSDDIETASSSLNRISQILIEYFVNLSVRTEELKELNQSENICSDEMIANFDLASADLESLSAQLLLEVPIHQRAFSNYLENMLTFIIRSQDFPIEESHHTELKKLRIAIEFILDQMKNTAAQTAELVNVITSSPPLTDRLNRARRYTSWTLKQFVQGIQQNVSLLETIRDQLVLLDSK